MPPQFAGLLLAAPDRKILSSVPCLVHSIDFNETSSYMSVLKTKSDQLGTMSETFKHIWLKADGICVIEWNKIFLLNIAEFWHNEARDGLECPW